MYNTNKIISIAFFVIAGILCAYFVWSLIHSVGYVSDAVSAGQITLAGNTYDIISFYMSSCIQYLVFALLMFGVGWMIPKASPVDLPEAATGSNDDNDDLDQWFNEMKNK